MKYVRVDGGIQSQGPVMHYSELDDSCCEVRKVEIFPNGHSSWASSEKTTGRTQLGQTAAPELEISREEFELVWNRWVR